MDKHGRSCHDSRRHIDWLTFISSRQHFINVKFSRWLLSLRGYSLHLSSLSWFHIPSQRQKYWKCCLDPCGGAGRRVMWSTSKHSKDAVPTRSCRSRSSRGAVRTVNPNLVTGNVRKGHGELLLAASAAHRPRKASIRSSQSRPVVHREVELGFLGRACWNSKGQQSATGGTTDQLTWRSLA